MGLSAKKLQEALEKNGLNDHQAQSIAEQLTKDIENFSLFECFKRIQRLLPQKPKHFPVHLLIYKTLYPDYNQLPEPCWNPTETEIQDSNLQQLMNRINLTKGLNEASPSTNFSSQNYTDLFKWSLTNYPKFWQIMCDTLNIVFDRPYSAVVNLDQGFETPKWFIDGKLNIVKSCFTGDPNSVAIISQDSKGQLTQMSYDELDKFSNCIANNLCEHFKENDRIAIIMPMTIKAVALYLGIIKAGMVVVSIADSFSAEEIKTRLRISETKGIFTQDIITREGKKLALYERFIEAESPKTIVIPESNHYDTPKHSSVKIRNKDIEWPSFLFKNKTDFDIVSRHPNDPINILFSSGTTGDPKAIPWTQTTPIKASVDAHLHHNLKPNDIFCWHTNLGWMMGPWLIFATLINRGTLALFPDAPHGRAFGEFIQNAKVTHLGVVPSLVKTWRTSNCMETLDWSAIKLFTSTGECSNTEDMLYLMYLANYRPIIEYCGGTEIGGAYITGTIMHSCAPSTFTTPTLGLDFVILDEKGHPSNAGEIALIPPSIGLSTELLNKNHHEVYFQGMPEFHGRPLRRHGDEASRYSNGFYRLHGRADDTMNLGGIKVSSAEIERTLNTHPAVFETAAIAIEPEGGGPALLVIYTVVKEEVKVTQESLMPELQNLIKQHLNPLFKIHEVIIIDALPRTASNKIMRRILRDQYQNKDQDKALDIKKETSENL